MRLIARGFSLLEVLIALAVISIALLALSRTGAGAPRLAAELEQRTLAQWVAQNALTEIRLDNPFPEAGSREGYETMGQRRWHWRAQIQDTQDPAIRRIDITIYRDGQRDALTTHTGFAGRY